MPLARLPKLPSDGEAQSCAQEAPYCFLHLDSFSTKVRVMPSLHELMDGLSVIMVWNEGPALATPGMTQSTVKSVQRKAKKRLENIKYS